MVNPFPHEKILDQTKLKAFANDKLNVTKMIISVFDREENIVGKGEIACTSNFSFTHNVFQKTSFPDTSKGVIMWEWVKKGSSMGKNKQKLEESLDKSISLHSITELVQDQLIILKSEHNFFYPFVEKYHSLFHAFW